MNNLIEIETLNYFTCPAHTHIAVTPTQAEKLVNGGFARLVETERPAGVSVEDWNRIVQAAAEHNP